MSEAKRDVWVPDGWSSNPTRCEGCGNGGLIQVMIRDTPARPERRAWWRLAYGEHTPVKCGASR